MVLSATLNPAFGQGGVVVGPADSGVRAVAVQSDGKIVEVGACQVPNNGLSSDRLAVCRFNADGSVDTSFGTNGQVSIAPPAGLVGTFVGGSSVAIKANGSIVLAAEDDNYGGTANTFNGIVIQLTPGGQLDPSFGTGGEFVLSGRNNTIDAVAVQADGKIVATGALSTSNQEQALAIRLTAAGVLDTSFNKTGELAFGPTVSTMNGVGGFGYSDSRVAITSAGQIYLATGRSVMGVADGGVAPVLARINPDGTLDSTYGTGGVITSSSATPIATITGFALQPDGKLIIASRVTAYTAPMTPSLVRLLPDGTLDPSFQGLAFKVLASTSAPVDQLQAIAVGSDGLVTVVGTDPSSRLFAEQFTADGRLNDRFGVKGRLAVLPNPPTTQDSLSQSQLGGSVAITPTGQIIVGGTLNDRLPNLLIDPTTANRSILAEIETNPAAPAAPGDYDGDGKTDIAAQLTSLAKFAYRPSTGTGDVVQGFGQKPLTSIPAEPTVPMTGDFDGDGKADVAAYIPALGKFFYRPSAGGADVVVSLGVPQADWTSLAPAPGDYDGIGRTEVAAYDSMTGSFIIHTAGGTNRVLPFGAVGGALSIPAPGDYDGDGKTDLAVFLPYQAVYAYRPSSGGKDVLTSFGAVGGGASIPTPGDYDGDGKADISVYIPGRALYAYRPSKGGADVLTSFGAAGVVASIPAPGDYDGDGATDLALFIPDRALYAYRPSSGGVDVLTTFGQAGYQATIPATSIPYAQAIFARPGPVTTAASTPTQAVVVALITDDGSDPAATSATTTKKKTGTKAV